MLSRNHRMSYSPPSLSSSDGINNEEQIKDNNKKKDIQLLSLINHALDMNEIDDSFLDEIEMKIDNAELSNKQWKRITKLLIKRVNSRNSGSEPEAENDINSNQRRNLWEAPKPLVPFEIGIKMLQDDLSGVEIGEETMKGIEEVERDAEKMAKRRMRANHEYNRLFREKEHWKYLAQTRLVELEKEINFRYELVFGETSRKTFLIK